MQLSVLGTILLAMAVLIAVRLVLFKVFNPSVELPVETTTASQATEEILPEVSMWPVVALLCVVVGLVVGLMMFGSVIGG